MRRSMMPRRATWRWCLAGGGAAFILLGVALGIPSGGASTENGSRRSSSRSALHHHPTRHRSGHRHAPGPTTTNAATGLGVPVPIGSSDGSSLDAVQPPLTTLPSTPPRGVGATTTPAEQSVPMTTAAAELILVIGLGAFAAGWTIGRRRALPQS